MEFINGKGKTKGEHGGAHVETGADKACALLLQVLLKPMGREEPGDSHPIINEWRWGMGCSWAR
jgi:hypothetical protein